MTHTIARVVEYLPDRAPVVLHLTRDVNLDRQVVFRVP